MVECDDQIDQFLLIFKIICECVFLSLYVSYNRLIFLLNFCSPCGVVFCQVCVFDCILFFDCFLWFERDLKRILM